LTVTHTSRSVARAIFRVTAVVVYLGDNCLLTLTHLLHADTTVPDATTTALKNYEEAGMYGHMEAEYRAGLMRERGEGCSASCALATQHFSTVAGRAIVTDVLNAAYERFAAKDAAAAVLLFAEAAEYGDEVSHNVVHVCNFSVY
jgi:TPR repeat protein